MLVEFQPEYAPGLLKLHQIQEELSTLLGNRQVDLVTPKFLNHAFAIAFWQKQRSTMMQRDDLVYVRRMVDAVNNQKIRRNSQMSGTVL